MSESVSASPFGVRTSALWTPARDSRSWIGASWRLSWSVAISRPLPCIIAAGAGAEVDPLLAGFCRRQHGRQLRTFILHFNRPLDKGFLGMNAGIAGVGA